jgi:hypothetical protein
VKLDLDAPQAPVQSDLFLSQESSAKSGDYLFALPNRRSRRTFCCALIAAATFRTRWVVIDWSGSLRGICNGGSDEGLPSVRSGWCSWTFSICHASRHCGQRPSAKHSILLHNVVRYRGGCSTLVIAERNVWTIRLFGSAWEARLGGRLVACRDADVSGRRGR